MKRSGMVLTAVAVLLGSLSPARASTPDVRGMGYLSIGLSHVRAGALQGRLDRTGLGYPSQPANHVSLGGGAAYFSRNLVLGLEGFVLLSPLRTGASFRTSLSGLGGVLQVGYALVKTDRFALFPLIGFGGGAFTWKAQRQTIPSSFEDVIRGPELGVSLLNASFLLPGALGADYWFPFNSAERPTGAIVIGLRVGYAYSPFGGNWEVGMVKETLELEGAPRFGINGPYLRLVIGGGGIGRIRS